MSFVFNCELEDYQREIIIIKRLIKGVRTGQQPGPSLTRGNPNKRVGFSTQIREVLVKWSFVALFLMKIHKTEHLLQRLLTFRQPFKQGVDVSGFVPFTKLRGDTLTSRTINNTDAIVAQNFIAADMNLKWRE
ncbi:MAG TPA: hypothetical protein DCF62_11085, partial [Porticoccaceae bacterium]|nr:hypothetical protein [Porticoccaceae bacterium]